MEVMTGGVAEVGRVIQEAEEIVMEVGMTMQQVLNKFMLTLKSRFVTD